MINSMETKLAPKTFNATQYNYKKKQCLSDLFWEQVQTQPNNTAVVYENMSLTYSELAKNSVNLAKHLLHLRVASDSPVGLFIEPSIELMIGVWGILISGGAYLPLSPEYPKERLKYMLDDTGAKIIVTQEKLKPILLELAPQDIQIVTLDEVNQFETLHETELFEKKTDICPKDLAYIIYTSGSTGKPKGVMIEHHSIVNQMLWLKTTFNLDNRSVLLQKTPMSFDAAQWEILAPSCGCQVVIGSSGVHKNPEKLIETIRKHNITILQCVPTLLQALLDINEFDHCQTLKQIFSGGEALSKHLALKCIESLPACRLVNLYGPTECTINTSFFSVDPDTIQNSLNTISIGKPIYNTQYYILDKAQNPVAIGIIGELYISGDGLARGYHHQPELTAEKFIDNPFYQDFEQKKLYKTGDLACWNPDGTVQYAGREDNQVKLRGFRIELDEIKSRIVEHDWVNNSAVILKDDPNTGYQNLIAFIELDPKEAALMDQGNHDSHHQSKESKAQVMMQLSNAGCRDKFNSFKNISIDLPGCIPTKKQKNMVFYRKSYRFYDGNDVISQDDVLRFLDSKITHNNSRQLDELSYIDFGTILRYFGQFISNKRLLPKYGYASPGALYATQMYFELNGVGDLIPGYYYYHPVTHQLILINNKSSSNKTEIKIHFIGKKSAIEPIYKNNIQEVLEIETGHMVGLFEKILPEYGLSIEDCEYVALTKNCLDVAEEDFYLGTFQIISGTNKKMDEQVEIYFQSHPEKICGLNAGQYQLKDSFLEKVSDELILRKHVIAINQQVYNRSSFGITVVSKTTKEWMGYINLGRKLQSFQMNDVNIGLMASGYSSKSGCDLPSAKRINTILGKKTGPSYFFIGGRISDEQKRCKGMKEDTLHMKGPAEIIRDDLKNFLPEHMLPNKIVVLDRLPLTVNGKIDFHELQNKNVDLIQREYIAPRTPIEQKIHALWMSGIKANVISINDNFFELGGNSLIAVNLITKINKELNSSLSLQVLFESSTIEKLAAMIDSENEETSSRLVPLQTKGSKKPIYCWPGLGGYCMNLRLLAKKTGITQPFYGLQAYGLNKNEIPYASIQAMAAADVKLIIQAQPAGPYTLWGYSFGARIAFEAAYQLEQSGAIVDNLFLIAPGSPEITGNKITNINESATYSNKIYLTILYSVFMGNITDNGLSECLDVVHGEEEFISFIMNKNSTLGRELIKKIINIVSKTYEFKYSFKDLMERQLNAPVTVFKAKGDALSFIEVGSGSLSKNYTVLNLKANHYSILKDPDIDELMQIIKSKYANTIEQSGRAYLTGNTIRNDQSYEKFVVNHTVV